jgi:DNA polymerase III delta prime subunit
MLTREAQNAMLKMLEDGASHVYFILCTTEPNKLLPTIRGRCSVHTFKALPNKTVEAYLKQVCKEQKLKAGEETTEKIAERCNGSMRAALQMLEKAALHGDEDDQLETVGYADASPQVIDLCKLIFAWKTDWTAIAKLLKTLDEEPESVRRVVMGYARAVLLGGGKMAGRAAATINAFRDPFYDAGGAAALLALACYEAVS